ncbi:MAG: SufBD protein [Actinobacteria bacterium]|nr:SufBD protein [Actinomycetota bacterium]
MDIPEILKNKINNLDEIAKSITEESQLGLLFDGLTSKDDKYRYNCFLLLGKISSVKVSWIYDKWDFLVNLLDSVNSYQRNIGLVLLANLSLSDTENKFENIIDKYLSHCNDEKFITQRQCIQNVWKIALNKPDLKDKIVNYLKRLDYGKHSNLIEMDIQNALKKIN